MTNKQSKEEKTLETILKLMCLAIFVFGVLLFSQIYN